MIPAVVHRIWLGGAEPEWTRAFACSWSRPGWEVRTWTEQRIAELFPLANQSVYDDAPNIVRDPAHVGQLRSDILRYEILQRFGGLYVDCDVECLIPFDDLVSGEAVCFAGWEIQNKVVNNAVIGARTAAPFINRIVRRLPHRVAELRGKRPNQLTGPGLMTEVQQDRPGSIQVLPQVAFYPYGFGEIADNGPGDTWPPESYAVHHWANQRRERGVPA